MIWRRPSAHRPARSPVLGFAAFHLLGALERQLASAQFNAALKRCKETGENPCRINATTTIRFIDDEEDDGPSEPTTPKETHIA